MADKSFRIVFDGRLAEGAHPDAVSGRLAASFGMDERTIDLFLQGKARVIKRGLDQPTAEKYLQKLAEAGLVCHGEGEATPASPDAEGTQQEPSLPAPAPAEALPSPPPPTAHPAEARAGAASGAASPEPARHIDLPQYRAYLRELIVYLKRRFEFEKAVIEATAALGCAKGRVQAKEKGIERTIQDIHSEADSIGDASTWTREIIEAKIASIERSKTDFPSDTLDPSRFAISVLIDPAIGDLKLLLHNRR